MTADDARIKFEQTLGDEFSELHQLGCKESSGSLTTYQCHDKLADHAMGILSAARQWVVAELAELAVKPKSRRGRVLERAKQRIDEVLVRDV